MKPQNTHGQSHGRQKSLFIVVNVDSFLLSHRLPVALAAARAGWRVTIVARDTGRRAEIEAHGLEFIPLPFERAGVNPLHELRCVALLWWLYLRRRPDVIHHVSLKACLLGCVAAKLSGRRAVVNAISGFGYSFTGERRGVVRCVVRWVLPLALGSRRWRYIFQNPDDVAQFCAMRCAPRSHVHLIKGSGVDLAEFAFVPPGPGARVRFVLPARMLRDKGVGEFIAAAELLRDRLGPGTEGPQAGSGPRAEFVLVGGCDEHNPAAISEAELRAMVDGDYIRWEGFRTDMRAVLAAADIVVLPSYREGLPKSLIEACAVGRPVVTTDAIGCRECVIDGENGFLAPVGDAAALADRMFELAGDPVLRARMGARGRELAEREFSIDRVVARHLEIYEEKPSQK